MLLSIGELAKLMGISVRTLRYYDAIGLLKPSAVTPAGYRSYDERAMETLQQILFFRELGFPLGEIGEILQHPEYDKRQALKRRRELLLLERARLDELLQIVENTLEGRAMKKAGVTAQQIQSRKREYAAEARERWGKTEAYREWVEKSRRQSPEKKAEAQRAAERIFAGFAAIRDQNPGGPEAQAMVRKWQDTVTKYYYTCTKEILAGLGQMYAGDPRFHETLDAYGAGTAAFMSRAIRIYCENGRK